MIRSTYTGIPESMLRHEYNVCDSFIHLNPKLTLMMIGCFLGGN